MSGSGIVDGRPSPSVFSDGSSDAMRMAVVKEGDLLDSWEDADERQLERHAAEYIAQRDRQRLQLQRRPQEITLADDDPLKGVAVAAPTLKILKRPTAGGAGAGVNGDSKPRPVRTYLQRQQDYAAARLRILGEAGPPDDAEQTIPTVQIKTDGNRLQTANRTRERPPVDFNTPAPVPNRVAPAQPRTINQPPAGGVSLWRAPRGPDSSKGFNLKR